jgi:RNA polymerase sigma-70 factor (ECF subfamily)
MRQILVLHDVQGYTHQEIAELLGINAGTCKSQLFKARARLRDYLEPTRQRLEGEEVCSI